MKKRVLSLAVLAVAGAHAQSSVTLFGVVDTTLSHYSVSGVGHQNALTNSGYNPSRLGVRGTEDLGGGLAASFWLEGALSTDDGTPAGLMFRRRSTVSLSGNWGELRLGRDYVPSFWNDTIFDPFGTNGVGSSIIFRTELTTTAAPFAAGVAANNPSYVRSDNSVAYFLPANLGGVYGQATYAFHEKPSDTGQQAGRYLGGRLGFASGPFNVAAGYGDVRGASPTTAASPDVKTWNVGGQWDTGFARLLAEYSHVKYGIVGADHDQDGWLVGTLVPVGAGEIRASYGHVKSTGGSDPRSSQWAAGYVYNLSKRTALYATYAHIGNSNGAALTVSSTSTGKPVGAANASSSGYDLGIRHSF